MYITEAYSSLECVKKNFSFEHALQVLQNSPYFVHRNRSYTQMKNFIEIRQSAACSSTLQGSLGNDYKFYQREMR